MSQNGKETNSAPGDLGSSEDARARARSGVPTRTGGALRTAATFSSWLRRSPRAGAGLARVYLTIWRSRLFDERWYLRTYPEVAESGLDPLAHYVETGWQDGYDPSPDFSTEAYLHDRRDVRRKGLNPLYHYIQHAHEEAEAEAARLGPDGRGPKGASAPPAGRGPASDLAPLPPGSLAVQGSRLPLSQAPAAAALDRAVSIIVLSRDGGPLIDELMESIRVATRGLDYEVIFVDHASSDDSLARLARWEPRMPLRVVRSATNQTFAFSNNRAAEIARHPHLLFLNNDVLLEPGNVTRLFEAIAEPAVGVAGLRLHDVPREGTAFRDARVQHTGIRFDRWDTAHRFMRPTNVEPGPRDALLARVPSAFPGVTAAVMLCRTDDFLAVGGFSEEYAFGYEDVDLCIKVRSQLGKESISVNSTGAVHLDAWSRDRVDSDSKRAQGASNIAALWRRCGYAVRRDTELRRLTDDGSWTGRPPVIAFAVSEARLETPKGDMYPAFELGGSLNRLYGWEVRFLPPYRWYDLEGVDVVVAMTVQYDPGQITAGEPNLLRVAWVRNWFEGWAENEGFGDFDVYLGSSERGCEYLREVAGVDARLLRLATNPRRFKPAGTEPRRTDYLFAGNFWSVERTVASALTPGDLGLQGAVVGAGWDQHPDWGRVWEGFVPYKTLPRRYADTKIVIDDANHVTAPWGSVNSRVFDGLASGALVVTNGALGAKEVFGERMPTYDGQEELHALLTRYANDTELREGVIDELRHEVLSNHTYDQRAHQLVAHLSGHRERALRVALKLPSTPDGSDELELADSLKTVMKRAGHSVRLDAEGEWDRTEGMADDVVVVLGGANGYRPREGQVNLLWSTGDSGALTDEELRLYDHVLPVPEDPADPFGDGRGAPVATRHDAGDPAAEVLEVAERLHRAFSRGPSDVALQPRSPDGPAETAWSDGAWPAIGSAGVPAPEDATRRTRAGVAPELGSSV